MQYRPLGRTGLNVSILGFGASWLGGVFRTPDDARDIRTVHAALDLGINFIDVAPWYSATKSESLLGKALKGVRRDRFILATKIGAYWPDIFDFTAARTILSVDESCERLGLDHIDLLQIHGIEWATQDQIVNETLPAMVKLKESGRVRHIGITGLPLKNYIPVIDRAGPGVVETMISFCHYGMNNTSLGALLPGLKERGIGVINASPTGMGLLTPGGPAKTLAVSKAIMDGCRKAADFCKEQGVDIVKLALQFAVSEPRIAMTLTGTANPEHLRQNVAFLEEPIDFEMMARVLEILRPIKNHNFTRGLPENHDPIIS